MIFPQPKVKRGKDGKEVVVIPRDGYENLIEHLEDLEDLLDLRKAKEERKNEPCYTQQEVETMFGVTPE